MSQRRCVPIPIRKVRWKLKATHWTNWCETWIAAIPDPVFASLTSKITSGNTSKSLSTRSRCGPSPFHFNPATRFKSFVLSVEDDWDQGETWDEEDYERFTTDDDLTAKCTKRRKGGKMSRVIHFEIPVDD